MLILISGAVGAGKSSVASILVRQHGIDRVSSGDYLRTLAVKQGLEIDRKSLQLLGDQLDENTDYSWLLDDVAVPLIGNSGSKKWLVDAVRKRKQVWNFRSRFEDVIHVHLSAPESLLRQRYISRLVASGMDSGGAEIDYERAVVHPNEVEARSLSQVADLVFDTSSVPPEEIAAVIGGGSAESSFT